MTAVLAAREVTKPFGATLALRGATVEIALGEIVALLGPIGRALVTMPKVLFADERTGSLDSLAGEKVMDLMVSMARAGGSAVLLVTHDVRVAAHADREVMVRDGLVAAMEVGI